MKKSLILLLVLFSFASLTVVSAEPCDPEISLLNQDPYPAVPGEYVKLVFQVDGLDNPDCNDFTFTLLEDYPIIFDPWEVQEKVFKKVNFIKDYESNLLIPYEVRIDENALDGSNPIEVRAQSRGKAAILKTFTLEVDDTTALFEAYVKDYSYTTNEMTIEVLNIAESDIEALTIEIPKQEGVSVKGSNRIVVGDLDSNEFTTADFEISLTDGLIDVNLVYSDSINVRRTTPMKISFDSSYFIDRKADQKTTGMGTYVFYVVIVLLVLWWILRRRKKKKEKKKRRG